MVRHPGRPAKAVPPGAELPLALVTNGGLMPGAAPPTRTDVAEILERLAKQTGDAAFSRAARALFQETGPGRAAKNDRAALSEIAWLLQNGEARTFNRAAHHVGRSLGIERAKIGSFVERLRRKSKNSDTTK